LPGLAVAGEPQRAGGGAGRFHLRSPGKSSVCIWLILSINISVLAHKVNEINQFRGGQEKLFSLTEGSCTGNE
jgi:hypothetical protein